MTLFRTHISFSRFSRQRQVKNEAAQFERTVRADWQKMCLSFLALTIATIALGIFIFGQVTNEEDFLSDSKDPVSIRPLDRFELERTVLLYESKRERFKALKQRPLSTPDPFIPEPPLKNN